MFKSKHLFFRPTVNSEVVSFVIRYRDHARLSLSAKERAEVDQLYDEAGIMKKPAEQMTREPIEITFRLLNTKNVIDPHCVFWNFTAKR